MAEKYLVPVDFSAHSDEAVDYALKLARERNARLILLYVIPAGAVNGNNNIVAEYYHMLEREARDNLAKLIRRKKLNPRDYELLVTHGLSPGEVIAREAKTANADMIIMASHGRSGLQRLFLGSVAERTLRSADRPVLIVKNQARKHKVT
jgi:nucleotide-binding universal stress UspA family protein